MYLKPWRELAQPHEDVRLGNFKQSEFAADITQVATGTAPAEYQDAAQFFQRTFITEGMRLLLRSVAERLSGKGGDPVIQLQTAFGGGKTHTMLAVFHLASRKVAVNQLQGIPPILDEANISELPMAHVAVLDGIKLSPSQSQKHGNLETNTLWGELAYQLLGAEGYAIVEGADKDGTSPGKEALRELISKAAPCVILMDELVAYIRQLDSGKSYKGGTFESNISFIQALTEAMKAVPDAILLASLPESEVEVGGTMGKLALDSLEKYFGRVESVWKPVATEEAFEIVRRRLFDTTGSQNDVEAVCREFTKFYKDNADKLPVDVQDNHYYERLVSSFPIHPEIFDRLYEDWSTLDKFQRTRGVLQYMAIVIHRLWQENDKDPFIMPGSLPMFDANVVNKSIHYLPQGWEPVIEREIDGPKSIPQEIDSDSRFGSIQAARRATRTIFLGSAPSNATQAVRGIKEERILLGCAIPGQVMGTYEDVLRRLRDQEQYLYSDRDTYWYDTKPNLRREMESRKANFNNKDDVYPHIQQNVQRLFRGSHNFGGVHVFTASGDIPDDVSLRLVVLSPDAAMRRGKTDTAEAAAKEILFNRGQQPRQKQNRLIFLAPDLDAIMLLKDQARTFLAWRSIVSDAENDRLNLDRLQFKQAKTSKDAAESQLNQSIRNSFKWLLCPLQEEFRGQLDLVWEHDTISPMAQVLVQEIEKKLYENEWLISEWSALHLNNTLKQWYFKNGVVEVPVVKAWQDFCNYLYMPRLANGNVLLRAIQHGIGYEEYFAFADGKDGDRYLGFDHKHGNVFTYDDDSLLIEAEHATAYAESLQKPTDELGGNEDAPSTPDVGGNTPTPTTGGTNATPSTPERPTIRPKHNFYGTVNINPVRAKMDFSEVIDEVVELFSSKLGVEVEISVEIQAKHTGSGFDESTQRAVKENCNVLRFGSAEFEEQ
ncbi:hypothetical protein GCM10011369_05780 [Neiella marina]|uniref:ATP-binding protein n=1 Tax=Neiella marina TaxID=508461 RepID=A0A8J2U2Q0_9GAMM|nr:DUF499 domain-containing protein [Neiella marina]GGA66989.1 hypothetical protein GCM10011369_05780 [Neiella marina]